MLDNKDQEISEKLQLQFDLTLKIAIATARQHKSVKLQLKQKRGTGHSSFDRVHQGQNTISQARENACSRCMEYPTKKENVQHLETKHLKCRSKSHFVCRTITSKNMDDVQELE